MRINTNVSALITNENIQNSNKNIQSSLERLSSGFRINKASDDASGLSITDKLRTQATSLNQSIKNGNSSIALLQIADKSMAEQSNILDIIKAKLIQANTNSTSDEGRKTIKEDINKLIEQLDNIAKQTNYNGIQLISNEDVDDSAPALSFQIGENTSDIVSISSIQANARYLGNTTVQTTSSQTNDTTNQQSLTTQTLNSSNNTFQGIETSGTNFNISFSTPENRGSISMQGEGGSFTADSSHLVFWVTDADTLNNFNSIASKNSNFTQTFTNGSYTLFRLEFNSTVDFEDYAFNVDQIYAQVMPLDQTYTYSNGDISSITYSDRSFGAGSITISGTYDTNGSTTTTSTTESQGESLFDLKEIAVDDFTKNDASDYQDSLDRALTQLNGFRSQIGSTQNQIESAVRNLMTQHSNIKSAESIIRDVDYATESSTFNKQSIISQAGSYALSQANQSQQNILRLLS